MPRITINLNEKETELKDMIRKLKKYKLNSNPYFDRSESTIAKMVLQPALKREFEKYVKAGK